MEKQKEQTERTNWKKKRTKEQTNKHTNEIVVIVFAYTM